MARKPKKQQDTSQRWLVTYSDLVSVLLAFFVALYAISQTDEAKFRELLKGLAAFENPAATAPRLLEGGGRLVGAGPTETTEQREPVRPDLNVATDQAPPVDGELVTQEDLTAVQQELEQALAEAGLLDKVTFSIESRGLVATMTTDDVLFESGSAVISAQGRLIVAAIAPTLRRFGNEIVVEGHTDNVPLNRGGYNNWNLSADRALAILRLLQEGFEIDPRRLAATGFGEFRPRASNDDAPGRRQNRRVEVTVAVGGDS